MSVAAVSPSSTPLPPVSQVEVESEVQRLFEAAAQPHDSEDTHKRDLSALREFCIERHPRQALPVVLPWVAELAANPHTVVRCFVAEFVGEAVKRMPQLCNEGVFHALVMLLADDKSGVVLKSAVQCAPAVYAALLENGDGERAQILLDSITAPPHGVVWQERGHMGSRVQGLRFVRAAAVLLIERQRPEASAALVDVLRAVVLPLANSRNTMKGVSNVLLTAAVNNLGDLASCSAKSVALLCGAAHEKGWPSSGSAAKSLTATQVKSVQSTLKAALVTSIKKGLRLLEENDLLSSVMDSLALLGATEHAELALKKAGGGAHLRRKRHTLASLQATAARGEPEVKRQKVRAEARAVPTAAVASTNVETPYGSFNSGDLAAAVVEVLAVLELPGSFARQGTPGSVSFFDLGRLLQERVYTGVPSMFFNLADVKVAPSSLQEATPGESAAVQGLSATAVPPENTVGSVAVATPSAAPSDPRLRDPRRRRKVVAASAADASSAAGSSTTVPETPMEVVPVGPVMNEGTSDEALDSMGLIKTMKEDCFRRMLSRRCAMGMQRSGRQLLRMGVFSRLMESQLICGLKVEDGVPTVTQVENSWAGGMLDVCLAELMSNFELGLQSVNLLLYRTLSLHLMGNSPAILQSNEEEQTIYEWITSRLCDFLSNAEERSSDHSGGVGFSMKEGSSSLQYHSQWTRVVSELPMWTPDVRQCIMNCATKTDQKMSALEVLKSALKQRPNERIWCVDQILNCTLMEDVELRNASLRIVGNVLFPQEKFRARVLQCARERMDKVARLEKDSKGGPNVAVDADDPEGPAVDGDGADSADMQYVGDFSSSVERLATLLFFLSTVQHSLLRDIVDYYGRCSAAVRKTFHGMVKKVLRGMGMDSPAVLDLLENPPPGEENWNMLLHVSQILCESGYSRSPPIVHAILRLYFEHTDRDPRFLVHVIQNLSLAELQEALPKLLTLPERVKQLAFRKLLSSPPIPGKSAVPADGLLVLLHTVDVPTKTAVEATEICFSFQDFYSQQVLGSVCQRLVNQHPLPKLLMRTMIKSMTLYPGLRNIVVSLLNRLVQREIWTDKLLWKGFLQCLQLCGTSARGVILSLPPDPVREVLLSVEESFFHMVGPSVASSGGEDSVVMVREVFRQRFPQASLPEYLAEEATSSEVSATPVETTLPPGLDGEQGPVGMDVDER